MTAGYRDHMIMWAKDVGRSVDYLENRHDIAKGKIGFMGFSWGGALAPLLLAVEPRISLAVIYVGGFYLQPSLPEADPVNFAPRVKAPVLMLNGRFDFFFPTTSSQEPMFALLGTPAEHKRRVVYETSHAIPRNEMIREVVDWMEKYLGDTDAALRSRRRSESTTWRGWTIPESNRPRVDYSRKVVQLVIRRAHARVGRRTASGGAAQGFVTGS